MPHLPVESDVGFPDAPFIVSTEPKGNLRLAKHCLKDCRNSHINCRTCYTNTRTTPRRLIDVQMEGDESMIRLHISTPGDGLLNIWR
jgi:hypothetical protein